MNGCQKRRNGTPSIAPLFRSSFPSLFESGEDLNTQPHLRDLRKMQRAGARPPIHCTAGQAAAAYP